MNADTTARNCKAIIYIFTRTPLHVGAGTSVGAIDQPIVRERHTGFPIIPASSLKGTFSDEWNEVTNDEIKRSENGRWLFGYAERQEEGSETAQEAAAGALQFTEAKLLAFPIRSARGSFAWITCPLILRRAVRDGALEINSNLVESLNISDSEALFKKDASKIAIDNAIVLEEYTFTLPSQPPQIDDIFAAFSKIHLDDPVWSNVTERLVILSDGMMSYFAQNACEIATHIRIDDSTGTVAEHALFNQENVPSETLFYSIINAFPGRGKFGAGKTAQEALKEFQEKLGKKPIQIGGDASTGLGWCTLYFRPLNNN